MDNPFQSPAILSFCTGLLHGIERGIEQVIGPIRVAAYVEIEAFLIENLVQQMEQGVLAAAPVFSDLKAFTGIASHFRNKIHGITAGYPCQPFSVAGERRGTDDPRHLFPHLLQIIDAVRPVWGQFENVTGHLDMGYEEVHRSLSDIGYAVEPGIFSASEAGATHQRKRLFILAIRRDALAHGNGEWKQQLQRQFSESRGWIGDGGEELGRGSENFFESNSGSAPKEHSQSWRPRVLPNTTGKGQGHGIDGRSGIFTGTEGMEHSTITRPQECRSDEFGDGTTQTDGEQTRPEQRSAGVANAISVATERITGGLPEEGGDNEEETYQRKRGGVQSGRMCAAVAYPFINGSEAGLPESFKRQKGKPGEFNDFSNERRSRPLADSDKAGRVQYCRQESVGEKFSSTQYDSSQSSTHWPAPPGIYQYPWEAPRVIPSMGCTINGYNFREDLLRGLGNGVVWQTEAIAFRVLLMKLIV